MLIHEILHFHQDYILVRFSHQRSRHVIMNVPINDFSVSVDSVFFSKLLHTIFNNI